MENKAIDLGIASELLTKNPIYVEAVEQLRKELYDKWVASDFADVENREKLFAMKIALELTTSKLDSLIQSAENEQITLNNKNDDNDDEQGTSYI